jgi:hypothetical protein
MPHKLGGLYSSQDFEGHDPAITCIHSAHFGVHHCNAFRCLGKSAQPSKGTFLRSVQVMEHLAKHSKYESNCSTVESFVSQKVPHHVSKRKVFASKCVHKPPLYFRDVVAYLCTRYQDKNSKRVILQCRSGCFSIIHAIKCFCISH